MTLTEKLGREIVGESTPARKRVLAWLATVNPWAASDRMFFWHSEELERATGLSRTTVSRSLKEGVEAGLVRACTYWIEPVRWGDTGKRIRYIHVINHVPPVLTTFQIKKQLVKVPHVPRQSRRAQDLKRGLAALGATLENIRGRDNQKPWRVIIKQPYHQWCCANLTEVMHVLADLKAMETMMITPMPKKH